MVGEQFALGLWEVIAFDAINRIIVNVPSEFFFAPVEAIVVVFLRGIEAEVIHVFVMANAIDEVVELDLGGVLAQEFDIDLIVRVIAIEEEGRGGALDVAWLHFGAEETILIIKGASHLRADIGIAGFGFDAGFVICDFQKEPHAVVGVILDVIFAPGGAEGAVIAISVRAADQGGWLTFGEIDVLLSDVSFGLIGFADGVARTVVIAAG